MLKKISSFTITIDDCDYVYNYDKQSFLSYWCDCPVEFPKQLVDMIVDFGNDINDFIERGIIKF